MNKAPTLSPDPDDKNLADPTLAVVADVNQLDLEQIRDALVDPQFVAR